MLLYLVRHGIAEDADPTGARSDAQRELTVEGRKKTAVAARGLRTLKVSPSRVGTSPLPRAKQTAEIFARVLCPKVALEECTFLAEGPQTARVLEWLGAGRVDSVMLVGHMPHVAELAANLLMKGGDVRMTLKRSAVCCISFEGESGEGTGKLEWLLQPRHLRALAR